MEKKFNTIRVNNLFASNIMNYNPTYLALKCSLYVLNYSTSVLSTTDYHACCEEVNGVPCAVLECA